MILARAVFVRDYMARHTNPWNRALHLVGVPLAPVLFLYFLARGRWLEAGAAFVLGYTLQWLGHRIEGNSMWDSLEGMLVKALLRPFRGSPEPAPAERRPSRSSRVARASSATGSRARSSSGATRCERSYAIPPAPPT